ncbi:alpha-L-fucosidase [Pelagicoccus mobilis]|uniref:alpha-L-fucosidase n=1 Tax=Pelagicoccus mobilis TaxID=415221 RepID=A0A934VN64_9BACT|nr:alpha-L-fucosidase [Pelagicoccus mobilis]MBK1875902.1 alpha-L-fucosidase [Pelagicoccus mobilis]
MKRLAIILLSLLTVSATAQSYKPEWDSLQNYEAPEWYEDAKLGFWVHWGVYSVPAFMGDHAGEWYGRWMYCKEGQSSRFDQGLAIHEHHKKTYGDPGKFGYKDFIPMFKAENFDADEWAELCVEGGAKFFTMMGAHHDAFCLWDTKLSKWNSVNMGPKRDLVGEIAEAVRAKGLKFGVSNHTAFNVQFFQWNHINGYDAKDPENQDLYGTPIFLKGGLEALRVKPEEQDTREGRWAWFARSRDQLRPSPRDVQRWIDRTKELADLYQPDLYYFDWGHREPEFEPGRREFGAHYYNKAVEWGKGEYGSPGVVLNYKSRWYKPGTAVRDYERGGMDKIGNMVWQTDDCVYDDHNWSYVPGVAIKPTNHIVDQLMDIVSKRGVLMLSFAPKSDGTFPDDQKKMMRELGAWLKINGEAVYATRPYEVYGEVGDKWYEKDKHGRKKMVATSDDIRFTRNKANDVLYATILDWPGRKLLIKTLAGADVSGIASIKLLGVDKELVWKQTREGLEIRLPKKPAYGMAYPVRIEFTDEIAKPHNS